MKFKMKLVFTPLPICSEAQRFRVLYQNPLKASCQFIVLHLKKNYNNKICIIVQDMLTHMNQFITSY
jgi:hypothetical protein